VIKRIVPVGLILAIACNSGGDIIEPTPASPDISTMNVGEVRVLNPSDIGNGIQLPAGSGDRDYIIIVGNTSPRHDVVANYVVTANVSAAGSFGILASPGLSAQSSILVNQVPLARTPQEAVENAVRSFERSHLSLRGPLGLARPSGFSLGRSGQIAAASIPAVGDVIDVNVPNVNTLCTGFTKTQARIASVSPTGRAILAVDTLDGPPLTLFTQAVLDSIREEFDNITFRTDSSYFGNPTDIDANGHVILLFTGEVNKLTPRGSSSFVGGFFFAGDFFPKTGSTLKDHCEASNLAEIFYLMSPDPTGRFGDRRQTSVVRQGTRGAIAHEFQHMINAGNRIKNNAAGFESGWLDEGLAHFAEDAVGRVSRGFGDLEELTSGDLVPCSSPCAQANDFDAFFFQNLARLSRWMDHPERLSPLSEEFDSLGTRGAAWAIVRYAADNYSGGNPRALMRKLAAGPDTGVTNFTKVTGASVDTLVKGWLVSMYADHLGIAGLNPKYQYRSYNMRSVVPPVAKGVLDQPVEAYPLKVQSIGSGSDNLSATNRSGTGTYYRLTVGTGAGAKNVRILDSSGNVASFPGEHIYVLRVQ
jgi:hypothetical protein